MYEEKSEFDEEREKQEEAAAKSEKADQDDKEQKQTITREKEETKWGKKRKSQQDIELRETSTSRFTPSSEEFDPYGGKPRHKTTSFMKRGGYEKLINEKEEKIDEAWEEINRKCPKFKQKNSTFTVTMDEFNRPTAKLGRANSKPHIIFGPDGEFNKKLPKTIRDELGPLADEVVLANEETVTVERERLETLQEEQSRDDISDDKREDIENQMENSKNKISQIEEENEIIKERMSLRERIKLIFKKYGFTAIAVVSAVSVVIGVIISNLSSGLAKMAKGVGNGLKDIGKKLGSILPGMVGAIASFIFRTAGKVVGFLAKNAWLLIVAAVIYFVDKFKNKTRK